MSKLCTNYSMTVGHINDDVKAIIANMIQGWIREVSQNFGGTSRGGRLGESYTCYTVPFFVK